MLLKYTYSLDLSKIFIYKDFGFFPGLRSERIDVTLYEMPPQFRVITTSKEKLYLYLPYTQFYFTKFRKSNSHPTILVSNSLNSSQSSKFTPMINIFHHNCYYDTILCLGSDYTLADEVETLNYFWNSQFNNSDDVEVLSELTTRFGNKLYDKLPDFFVRKFCPY